MSEAIEELNTSAWIIALLLSMVPLIELKEGIPYGISAGLGWWQAYLCGVVGGIIVAIVLTLCLKPLFNWLRKVKFINKIVVAFELRFSRQAQNIDDRYGTGDDTPPDGEASKKKFPVKRMIAIMFFVSIPIPLTGVWTGTAIAVFIGLKRWQSILSAGVGVLISGAIMTVLSTVVPMDYLWIIQVVMLAIAVVGAVIAIIRMYSDYKKNRMAQAVSPDGEDADIPADATEDGDEEDAENMENRI